MFRCAVVAFVGSAVLAGCGSGARPAAVVGNRGGDGAACVEGELGRVAGESVAVAAAPDSVYWLDYNFGTLQRRGRDGGVTTLAAPGTEQNSEELIVAGEYLYWDSKAEQAIRRMKLGGGAPETLIQIAGDDFPYGLAVAGDVVYTRTFAGELMWWHDGQVGQRSLAITAMAARGRSLYLGNASGIGWLDEPDGEVYDLTMDTDPVLNLVVADEVVFWVEDRGSGTALWRRTLAGGASEAFAADDGGALTAASIGVHGPVAARGGAFVPVGEVVLFAPASGPPVARVVARAPGDVVDLAVDGDALIAALADGRVYRLCLARAP